MDSRCIMHYNRSEYLGWEKCMDFSVFKSKRLWTYSFYVESLAKCEKRDNFVREFNEKFNEKYDSEENNDEIILTTNIQKYNYKAKLYISKKTSLPTKIEVLDDNNQNKIYIEYKEIKLNNIHENNIFAFATKDINKEV